MKLKIKPIQIWILTFILFIFASYSNSYENAVYIWQNQWSDTVGDSVQQINPLCRHFMVYAGEIRINNNHFSFSQSSIRWTYLQNKGTIAIDIRLRNGYAKITKNDKDISLLRTFNYAVHHIMNEAHISGVTINELQIDYDCPTLKLEEYTRLIKSVKTAFPKLILSITALPTWMDSPDFPSLINAPDYYVLQLHSFEIPRGNHQNEYIFSKDNAPEYFQKALFLNKPFYVSLPTYGYEAAYSKNNRFLGLRAEGGIQILGSGVQYKLLETNPADIVEFLRNIDKTHSAAFKGVCWFRLPISLDKYNWNIKTLESVIQQKLPQPGMNIEITTNTSGTNEVYIINSGEMNLSDKISFNIYWNGEKPYYDILGNYEYTEAPNGYELHITGIAPKVSQKRIVGWFRAPGNQPLQLTHSEVYFHEPH